MIAGVVYAFLSLRRIQGRLARIEKVLQGEKETQ